MKSYEVKYEIGQKVFIFMNMKIIKGKVDVIRISHIRPGDENFINRTSDYEISYLVIFDEKINPSGLQSISYDWYKENCIFLNKEDLINNIKEL